MATIQATKQTSPVNVEHRKKLDIRPGDTVRVYTKVVEKGKTRLQPFEGMVLARKHGSEPGATFTVRKISSGVGIERIFPLYSPNIEKIELIKRAKTRRSKLYYIREKAAKQIRRKMKAVTFDVPDTVSGEVEPEEENDNNDNNDNTGEDTQGTEAQNTGDVSEEKDEAVEEKQEENNDNDPIRADESEDSTSNGTGAGEEETKKGDGGEDTDAVKTEQETAEEENKNSPSDSKAIENARQSRHN